MSFARLIRILRSASFRLPLIYAVLFVLSAGALFVTVYWTATAAMQADMAAVLRTEAYQLAEIHSRRVRRPSTVVNVIPHQPTATNLTAGYS